jgi:hypothetical protein
VGEILAELDFWHKRTVAICHEQRVDKQLAKVISDAGSSLLARFELQRRNGVAPIGADLHREIDFP